MTEDWIKIMDTTELLEINIASAKLNEAGKTIILVTHDEAIAKKCKRILQMVDGKIVKDRSNS